VWHAIERSVLATNGGADVTAENAIDTTVAKLVSSATVGITACKLTDGANGGTGHAKCFVHKYLSSFVLPTIKTTCSTKTLQENPTIKKR
jgi:hypothetical protein